MVAEHDIELVILDSVGPACGDIMAPDLIIRAFNAVRHITSYTGAAALLLGHTTKEDRKQGNQYRLPLGSIYFENLPRATWELRSEEGDSDVLEVGLFSRKSNLCGRNPSGSGSRSNPTP